MCERASAGTLIKLVVVFGGGASSGQCCSLVAPSVEHALEPAARCFVLLSLWWHHTHARTQAAYLTAGRPLPAQSSKLEALQCRASTSDGQPESGIKTNCSPGGHLPGSRGASWNARTMDIGEAGGRAGEPNKADSSHTGRWNTTRAESFLDEREREKRRNFYNGVRGKICNYLRPSIV